MKNKEVIEDFKPTVAGEAWVIRGDLYWFVGVDPTDPRAYVFSCGDYIYESWQKSLTKEHAQRSPENDKIAAVREDKP